MKKKALLISLIALAMALCMFAGATIAYLFVISQDVVNTFAPSNIELTLVESDSADTDTDANKNEYQMIPGATIAKDPKVSASADIAYYVFVKVEKSSNVDTFLEYSINTDEWTALTDVDGVYYKAVAAGTDLTDVSVISGDTVTVKSDVTKDMMNAFDTDKDGTLSATEKAALPKLAFKAYAIQQQGFDTVKDAWDEVSQ